MESVVVDLRALEEAFARCLFTHDFRVALWSALLGGRMDLETREAVQQVKVTDLDRLSGSSRLRGLAFGTTDGRRWQMTLGQVTR